MADDLELDKVYELAHQLDERVKELNCLYGISQLAEDRRMSVDEFLRKVLDIIPRSWQYSDVACARITLTDKELATANFVKSDWCQSESIVVNGKYFGSVEVCYIAEMPESDEGPFLNEERHLIRAVAERLGHIIERTMAEADLKRWYEEEKHLRERLQSEIQWRISFTRNLIHELKTPLTSLVATSQLLYEEEKDRDLNRLARFVWEGANNLNYRIDELHDIVRGEMGTIEYNPKPLDLKKLLINVKEETHALAEQYDMRVEIDLPPVVPEVYADPVRIRQIVLNLLNNAYKYASEGGKVIIRASVRDSFLTVEVKDFGPGMKDLNESQLFDPGYQTISPGKRSGGLGIGLSLCKILVELHGGKIWVETQPGQGSVVYFTLPLPEKTTLQQKK